MSAEPSQQAQPSGELAPPRSLCPACAKPHRPRVPTAARAAASRSASISAACTAEPWSTWSPRPMCASAAGSAAACAFPSTMLPWRVRARRSSCSRKHRWPDRPAPIWTIVAAVVAGFGVCSVLVLALVISVASPSTPAAVIAGLAAMVPFGFAALAFRKSRVHRADIAGFVEAAWVAAASDIARARGRRHRRSFAGQADADHGGRSRSAPRPHVEQEFAHQRRHARRVAQVHPPRRRRRIAARAAERQLTADARAASGNGMPARPGKVRRSLTNVGGPIELAGQR